MIKWLKEMLRMLTPTLPQLPGKDEFVHFQPEVQAAQDDFQRYLREVEERDKAARLLGMQRQAEQAERDAARWTGEPRC